jgi:hypothetical protein
MSKENNNKAIVGRWLTILGQKHQSRSVEEIPYSRFSDGLDTEFHLRALTVKPDSFSRSFSYLLAIIHDVDVVCVPIPPIEPDPELIVDPNAVQVLSDLL